MFSEMSPLPGPDPHLERAWDQTGSDIIPHSTEPQKRAIRIILGMLSYCEIDFCRQ